MAPNSPLPLGENNDRVRNCQQLDTVNRLKKRCQRTNNLFFDKCDNLLRDKFVLEHNIHMLLFIQIKL